ncbi:hypothetical protein [Mucilaginibacter psychrotolerans]|uniref:RiboL-PSP-HEPN domain-containing protein n=1 Tax=Mucilaginibacter psychrotolerans TaxID=1524096 RepID=A0A4Y8S7L4_9SPHI|nr:hypothetical protein [Mucilaginibacter psychrotolerans]TFF34560.1 hypothetical protein E2R66_21670 [Mucilaginibacter psychrotolerans]
MSPVRKPHNLITEYWDDMEYFLAEAEKVEKWRKETDAPIFPKRYIRHCILSAFLFLEAFINGEYFEQMNFADGIAGLKPIQKRDLETMIIKTSFDEKWSSWVADFMEQSKPNLQNEVPYKNLLKLKSWRNQLTHYKLHELFIVAHNIQTISNAREARKFSQQAIRWYYDKTKFEVPEWIARDIMN